MQPPSSANYRFGDLLALVREYWVRQMDEHLTQVGHPDYRRTDAALVRLLRQRPRSIGQIGGALRVSRQAARKLVTGLERRGYATTARDQRDARALNVSLTPRGQAYAAAIVDVVEILNQRLLERVDPEHLRAADAVLRASLPDQRAIDHVRRLAPPPP